MDLKKVAIDLFSGAGGLSTGAALAGIEVAYAIENDKYSILTYQRNHPTTKLYKTDIREVSTKEINITEPFIVFGGPPCQGFSLSNKVTRNLKNEKNQLYKDFVRFVSELKPHWFLLENVEGIVNFENGTLLPKIKDEFLQIGYTITDAVLVASDYGVPQNRNRYFLVGNRHNINFTFPSPLLKKVSVWEAICDLPALKNGDKIYELPYSKPKSEASEYAKLMRKNSSMSLQNYVTKNDEYIIERYKHIKQGQNWRAIPAELMDNYKNIDNCHSGIYRRLVASKPSIVISNYRKNMLIHPYDDRGLSVREAARIQSFPDDFIFEGTIWFIQQQIGNAVPPTMAKEIFKKIIDLSKLFD